MENKERRVFDVHGRKYALLEKIGAGGQGTVWTTNYEGLLVKLAKIETESLRRNYYRRLKYIMLREDLPHSSIAAPKDLLAEPDCGYVMELMDSMKPLDEILLPSPEEKDVSLWYRRDGAIRRRIFILHHLAGIISEIHAKGFVFGDLSPNNIFVSQNNDFYEVQLIDCDNLSPGGSIDGSVFFTEKYAAPELILHKSGYDTLTDAWSFAVIAYQLLTLRHPFIGDKVSEGEPELEEMALRGEFPWVEDQNDSSNRCTTGLPFELVAFKPLRELFQKTFSAANNPWARPGVLEWHDALQRCLRGFLRCEKSDCGEYFVATPKGICPFCFEQKSGEAVLFSFARWEPDADMGHRIRRPRNLQLPTVILNKGESFSVDQNLHLQNGGKLEILFDDQQDLICMTLTEAFSSIDVTILQKKGNDIVESKQRTFSTDIPLKIRKKIGGGDRHYSLHFGDLQTSHRIITFTWRGVQ